MQRLPKRRSRPSVKSRCEMRWSTSVLMPVRRSPPKSAAGRGDCPQICPHSGAERDGQYAISATVLGAATTRSSRAHATALISALRGGPVTRRVLPPALSGIANSAQDCQAYE